MPTTRIEEDLLGAREIPNDAYYGVHTLRAIENFKISGVTVNHVPEFIRGMVQVKKAEALANRDARVLSADVSRAIVKACDLVLDEGRCMDQFPVDVFQGGAGTSVNMNTNEVIANLALETMGLEKGTYSVVNPNDHVNKSQSTNDAYPTGFRIAVYRMVIGLVNEVQNLGDSFGVLAKKNERVLKMGRTQLQDAVPMTVGQEFDAFRVLMEEEVKHLIREVELLLEVNLGATAIGTGLNTPDGFQEIVVKRLAEVTGLDVKPAPNLIEATSDTGAYVSLSGALKRFASKLSMICNDLRLLSSGPRAGLNEINLPEMQAGSSIMPAKVNPVIPEVVNQVCFKVIGNDMTVTMASEAGQLQLNVMEPVIGQALFESISLLQNACITLRERCVAGITVNEDICAQFVMNSIGIVTYLNDIIGHHEGDLIGKECALTGKSVREVVLERGLMTQAELDRALSVENLMHPKYMGEVFPDDPEREIVQ
ncbi:aspartate ammonia-lyase [Arcanobacterium pluranimalium]|uniref:aspartate ammonia-lyase n=1 Tax=Arcanobacterium pluranimalium TaxID=108028 RepID=UPI00195EED68|nr:aspartate ammonia-lyase [Arcanobacterium pluranimalium]MBM7825774.1 aspartate ammonia-lyase [Arcanobacterium pluranimalium]